MKLPHELVQIIESFDYRVDFEDNEYMFSKLSPCGYDFVFYVQCGDTLIDFAGKIYEKYLDYDVSYETYLWLDNSGHGKNGAPYNMKDLYEDMETCGEYIYKLYEIVEEYI